MDVGYESEDSDNEDYDDLLLTDAQINALTRDQLLAARDKQSQRSHWPTTSQRSHWLTHVLHRRFSSSGSQRSSWPA